ncbi:MAG TPA: glycosyltransferase family 39 protein [Burkholderiaceae bacterium]|nr:glycosyltransferase family 39 protein [Burkholderiaceae bacterium]
MLSPNSSDRRITWAVLALLAFTLVYRVVARESLGVNLHYDEAQYFAWSLTPGFGYFSKPPMIAWTIGAARAVCGESEACIRLPSALAFAVTGWLVYLIGRRIADVRSAWWSVLAFVLLPLVSFYAWFMTTDALLLMFWAATFYSFIRALDANEMRWWIATGVLAGFGLLSKYTMGIFAISALGFLAFDARERRLMKTPGPWIGALVAALLFAPNVLWNSTHAFATLQHTADIAQAERDRPSLAALARFLAEQVGVLGPLTALAFVLAAATGFRAVPNANAPTSWTARRQWRLLAWFALPFLAIIGAQAFFARALANWAAPTAVAASILAGMWLARPAHRWFARTAIALNVAVALTLYHHPLILNALGVDLPVQRDPLTQVRGWDAYGQCVRRLLDEQGARLVAEDRRLMSELIYYARAHDALIWNPSGIVDNHYRLTRDVRNAPNGPFVFVAATDRRADLERDFASVESLALTPCTLLQRPLHAYRLGNFIQPTRQ